MTETKNVTQYHHIHKAKGSYDNLLIWQSYIVIKYHHKYVVVPNYDDFNDEGKKLSLDWATYKKRHNEN
jgi:hypothetical protein